MDKSYIDLINEKKKTEIAKIKECNKYTSQFGLILTDKDIINIMERRADTLKETERVELRSSIIEKIVNEFCNSPFISQKNYAETLYELIDIFYKYKNDTLDLITDDELIEFMKKSFDGICQGDLEYLSGTAMYKMRENLLDGKPLDFKEEEDENIEEY